MSKKKHKDVPYVPSQEDEARETILGLRRPKPFNELSSDEKIEVLCVQLKQLRTQFHNLRSSVHDQGHTLQHHTHFDGKVVMSLDNIHRGNHMVEAGASEFDPLR